MSIRRFGLRKAQWQRIEPLLPDDQPQNDLADDRRLFVEAVLYRYRAGILWRDLPPRYGHSLVVRNRFFQWRSSGVWEAVFHALLQDPDNEYAMYDSDVLKALRNRARIRRAAAL